MTLGPKPLHLDSRPLTPHPKRTFCTWLEEPAGQYDPTRVHAASDLLIPATPRYLGTILFAGREALYPHAKKSPLLLTRHPQFSAKRHPALEIGDSHAASDAEAPGPALLLLSGRRAEAPSRTPPPLHRLPGIGTVRAILTSLWRDAVQRAELRRRADRRFIGCRAEAARRTHTPLP